MEEECGEEEAPHFSFPVRRLHGHPEERVRQLKEALKHLPQGEVGAQHLVAHLMGGYGGREGWGAYMG